MTSSKVDPELEEAAKLVRRLSALSYIAVGLAAAALAIYSWKFWGPFSEDPAKWGAFGDYVGGVLNPTFSLFALLALLGTLGLQVRELRVSANELRNSAEALRNQNETLRQQTFEGTFFQSLRLHNDIVASMEIPELSLKGRACLERYLQELETMLANEGAAVRYEDFRPNYEVFYRERQATLGHYFRMLYNIIKLVKRTEGIDQRFYTNLVRAQLSTAELMLIFYNCLSDWGREKFKPLVEEFALLKTMPNDVIPEKGLLHRYSPAAFGGEYPRGWL